MTLKKALLLSLIAGSIATHAMAQEKDPVRAAQERACGRDVSRFCKQVINESELTILGCLQQKRTQISQACQKVLKDNGV